MTTPPSPSSRGLKRYVNPKAKRGYDTDESTYAEAGTVDGDTILVQTERAYDDADNLIRTSTRQRYHNASPTATGELTGPTGPAPRARVSYVANWHDGIGHAIATADYGTNGGSAFTRPDTVPARSDNVLVMSTVYGDAGEVETRMDPAEMVTRFVMLRRQKWPADACTWPLNNYASGHFKRAAV